MIWLTFVFPEKYFDMKKVQCKEGLDIYKKFLTRMTRISEFLKVAEVRRGEAAAIAKYGEMVHTSDVHPNSTANPLRSVIVASGNRSRGHPRPFPGKTYYCCFWHSWSFDLWTRFVQLLANLIWPNLGRETSSVTIYLTCKDWSSWTVEIFQ